MTTNGDDLQSNDNDSIRSLLSSVKSDAQSLLKAQVELTSTELKESTGQAVGVGGMFIGALLAAGMGGIFVLITIAYVLVAIGLPVWAGFGIVALALLVIGGILALIGRSAAKNIKGPELSKLEWERTQAALSGKDPEKLPALSNSSSVATSPKNDS